MTAPIIQRREPALVLVLSIITFGIYLPFWYHGIYEDLEALTERTPTGHGFWLDFLFVILTFAIYGIWVDYQISQQIAEFEERNGLGPVQDTSIIAGFALPASPPKSALAIRCSSWFSRKCSMCSSISSTSA